MTQDSLEARFAARMGALLGPDFPSDIALAVSGGGDSMAMLALCHGWARIYGVRLHVVTVDHGLRTESADEAAMVARECAALGHPHTVLTWHWTGQGNLQDAARQARLSLIDAWRGDIGHVLFAHTKDDVAETFLMRLTRGSGVEGLSAIANARHVTPNAGSAGFMIVRPLLNEARADLRRYLKTLHIPYVDDPSNNDPRFDRVQARGLLSMLSDHGLSADVLTNTARRMRRARNALTARAVQVAGDVVQQDTVNGQPIGDLLIDRDRFAQVEEDTQLRLLAAALQWVSSAPYRPRAQPLEALLDRILSGGGGTLHGCEVRSEGARFRVFREYAALDDLDVKAGTTTIFDHRWQLEGSLPPDHHLRALGPDGWAQITEKPSEAPPFHAARSLPAIFAGETVVACPPLGVGPLFPLVFRPTTVTFVAFLESD